MCSFTGFSIVAAPEFIWVFLFCDLGAWLTYKEFRQNAFREQTDWPFKISVPVLACSVNVVVHALWPNGKIVASPDKT